MAAFDEVGIDLGALEEVARRVGHPDQDVVWQALVAVCFALREGRRVRRQQAGDRWSPREDGVTEGYEEACFVVERTLRAAGIDAAVLRDG